MRDKLNFVQVLRALAAMAVVSHHVFRDTADAAPTMTAPPAWLVELGAFGVDIFFVISGFLMTYIAEPYFSGRKSPSSFLAQRVIRIWPPYMIVTLIACAEIFVRRGGAWPFDLQPARLASLLFVPSFNEKGWLQPIIGPGWTLNYEMLFYLGFTLTLLLGRSHAFWKLAAIIGGLFVIGLIAPPGVIHSFLGDPILFEFLFGAAIGFALKSGRFVPTHGMLWILAVLAGLAALALAGLGSEQRLVSYGLPAAAIFIGFFALEKSVRWPRLLLLLGDASYSIYLVHTLVIYRVTKPALFAKLHFGELSALAAALAAFLLAILVGLGFYWFVERPLLRACQRGYNHLTGLRTRPPLVAQ